MKDEIRGKFTVSVDQGLTASHYLPEEGEEKKHSHDYMVTFTCEGDTLDQRGYLVGIVELKQYADQLLSYLDKKLLNSLAEFRATPPSIEQIAQLLCLGMKEKLDTTNVKAVTVSVAESAHSRASYRSNR